MNKLAAMFPGQGSQYVGMANKLYEEHTEVRELYQVAKRELGFDLYHLCSNGPVNELQKTENTQPAILTASVAAFRVYQKEGGRLPEYGAGHSLGEITALCCAGAVSFADAVRLVRLRGKLMQEGVPEGVGAMAAVRGLNSTLIEQVCLKISRENHIVVVSNYNSPEQTVISGNREAVEEAGSILQEEGGAVIPLKVSAPFHSPLMASCAEKFRSELELVSFHDFLFPVISNVTGKPYQGKECIAEYLYGQITRPVLWQDIMQYLQLQGVDTAIEFGPRAVLKDLAVKNITSIKAFSFEDNREGIHKLMQSWGTTKADPYVNLFARCVAAAVSTPNNNWDETEYQTGAVKPYRELVKLAEEAKANGSFISDGEIQKGMGYLRRILKTKKVSASEQLLIEKEILGTK